MSCLEFETNDCPRAENCATLFVWEGLYDTISKYLDGITIADIVEHGSDISGSDYCI